MRRSLLTVSAALLLAACAQTPTPNGAGAARIQVLSIPAQVTNVTLDLHGDDPATAPDSHTYPLTIQDGTASVTLPNIAKGRYTLTARGYDNADQQIVLYKATVSVNVQSDAPIALKMNRTTSAITVNATGVTAKSNVLVAKVGGLEARLLVNGSTATGTLQGVPTARNLNVLVEGRTSSGALQQQGSATLNLSEQDQNVTVALADVQAAAPSVTSVSGPASVKKGEAYTVRVQASAGTSQTLKTLKIEWGDGSSDTPTVSGNSLDGTYTHTYSAAGSQNVNVTVTNDANLSATGSATVSVVDTASPPVTVDVGAPIVSTALTATGLPAGTERVQAVIDAPLAAQRVRRQDLKAQYTLELAPRPDGTWGGALGLPTDFTYTVTLKAITGGQTTTGAAQSISTTKDGENTFTLPFTAGGTANCPVPTGTLTNIGAVQGSGDASPLAGQTVTVRGVVTLDAQAGLKGFFVQDAQPDSDPATSDGVFVYTNTAPQSVQAGDLVQLAGKVSEFNGTTELDTITGFTDCGAGTLPQPTVVSFPLTSATALERVEGMLVTVPETLTVTDNYRYENYGEVGLSSGGRVFNKTNGNGTDAGTDDNLRRIRVDDVSSATFPNPIPYLNADLTLRTGDTLANLTGVLHYANSAYKVEPTVAPAFTNSNARQAQPDAVPGSLRVGGANVLNFFTDLNPSYNSTLRGANSEFEFNRQRTKIVKALLGLNADVLALSEVQNNGDTTLQNLVDALNAATAPGTYAPVLTGTIGTDVIKAAIIYKPAKVDLVGGYAVDNNSVYSRPPVAQTFRDKATGGVFTVVANHFKSKGSCPTSGDTDQGQGCWNAKRVDQANALLNFVSQLKQTSGDQDVLLMGDFNSYGAEDPIKTITAGGFVSENLRIPAEDRYSYQFSGSFGYLDHALASTSLDAQVAGITEWHINSDEPIAADYNAEYKNIPQCVVGTDSDKNTCQGQDLWQDNAFRASDHDPVLVGLNLTHDADPTPAFTVNANGAATVTAGQVYTLNISTSATPDTLKVNWGDGTADEDLSAGATSATHTFSTAGSYTLTVTGVKGSDTKTATVNVTVNAAPSTAASLVISAVYGGGGNSGAPYRNDYVELFNPTAAPIALGGKSLQYASASGTFSAFSFSLLTLPSANIPAGGYYLVQLAAGANTAAPALPSPDATGSLALSGTNGKIALVGNTEAITGRSDADVLDFVGYGSVNEAEGLAVAALSNTTAASRNAQGCTDTGDNSTDFTVGAPAPRNSATTLHPCQ